MRLKRKAGLVLGRTFEISISEEESRPQCKVTIFLYFIYMFTDLGIFSCQILSLSVVGPIAKKAQGSKVNYVNNNKKKMLKK